MNPETTTCGVCGKPFPVLVARVGVLRAVVDVEGTKVPKGSIVSVQITHCPDCKPFRDCIVNTGQVAVSHRSTSPVQK